MMKMCEAKRYTTPLECFENPKVTPQGSKTASETMRLRLDTTERSMKDLQTPFRLHFGLIVEKYEWEEIEL